MNYHSALCDILLHSLVVLLAVPPVPAALTLRPCTVSSNTRGLGTVLTELQYTTNSTCFRECLSNSKCLGVTVGSDEEPGTDQSSSTVCQLIGSDYRTIHQPDWSAASLTCFGSEEGEKAAKWIPFNSHSHVLTAIQSEETPQLYLFGVGIGIIALFIVCIAVIAGLRGTTPTRNQTFPNNSTLRDHVIENQNSTEQNTVLPSYTEAETQTNGEDWLPSHGDATSRVASSHV